MSSVTSRLSLRLQQVLVSALALVAVLATWGLTAGRTEAASVVAFILLVIVVLSAFFGNLPISLGVAVVAALGYDAFYLPPVGTLSITSPADWVTLGGFVLTSVLISALTASSARIRTRNGQLEVAFRQYHDFAAALLNLDESSLTLTRIAEELVRVFELEYCSLHVFSKGKWDHYRGSATKGPGDAVEQTLQRYDERLDVADFADEQDRGVRYVAVKRGDRSLLLLAAQGELGDEGLNAAAYLVGLKVARATV
jgi:K+-sensing histidine kinase KdpD